MANEVENQTLNFFAMGIREFVGAINESSRDKDSNSGGGRMIVALFFFGIAFLFCGAEAMRMIFRRDFAKDTVGIVQILIASLAFIAWGGWCFVPAFVDAGDFDAGNIYMVGGRFSFAAVGVFYVILGFRVLIKGYNEWQKSNNYEGGTLLGTTTILKSLRNSGWSEFKIRQIGEPFALIGVSVLLAGFNLFFAPPLLFCALSMIIFNIITYKKVVESAPLKSAPGGRFPADKDKNTAR